MALTFTSADVVLAAPELATVTGPQWAQVLADVALELNSDAFASVAVANRLGIQLAAHFATERYGGAAGGSGGGGASGPLSSVTVGPVSKTFAVSSAYTSGSLGAAALSATKYGREYLRLMRVFGPRLAVT